MPAPSGKLDTFGTMVRDARDARGWNQTVAGERLGMNQGRVSDIETGELRVIDADTIIKLVEVFELPQLDLTRAAAERLRASRQHGATP